MNLLAYLSMQHILYSVTIPLIFSIMWYIGSRKNLPSIEVCYAWMWCVFGSFVMARWIVTEDTRSLTGVNVFFIYLAFYLHLKQRITASAAYVLSFLELLTVDMAKASQLIPEEGSYFYVGIGGAGMFDALCIYPLLAAGLVKYVEWRTK